MKKLIDLPVRSLMTKFLLISAMLLFGTSSLKAAELKYLTFRLQGGPVSFALSDHPTITYENNDLVVTTATEVVRLPVAEISFGHFSDEATGLYELQYAPPGVVEGRVRFSGLQKGAVVVVYSLDGKRLSEQSPQDNGVVDIDLRRLPKGTYVIKSPTQHFKVTNR